MDVLKLWDNFIQFHCLISSSLDSSGLWANHVKDFELFFTKELIQYIISLVIKSLCYGILIKSCWPLWANAKSRYLSKNVHFMSKSPQTLSNRSSEFLILNESGSELWEHTAQNSEQLLLMIMRQSAQNLSKIGLIGYFTNPSDLRKKYYSSVRRLRMICAIILPQKCFWDVSYS